MADALRKEDPLGFATVARNNPNFKPLTLCALEYAAQGITSLEEVFRVTEQLAEESLETMAGA